MSAEIGLEFITAQTVYANVRNRTSGYIWNGSSFEAYSSASGNQNSYVVAMTEQGTASAHYVGTMPTTIGPGTYDVVAKRRVNAWYAETDTTIGVGQVEWNASIAVPLSDMATSGQIGQIVPIRIFRGQMVRNFPVKMVSSSDHVSALTSGTMSGQVSRDGAAFTALQSGSFTEIGLGWYVTNLTSGDLLANTVALVFTATGVSGGTSDQRDIGLVLQRTSGQLG